MTVLMSLLVPRAVDIVKLNWVPGLPQGERITQGISYADVADVCLKALHDRAARNKTFEVCHEYTPEEGLEQYELVAHLPDKANNYLGPALAVLEKNT